MFLTATKVAIVESLRSVWFDGNQDPNNYTGDLSETDQPYPRRITVEYPEEAHDWPVILVQVRPTTIAWTGIMPDEIVNAGTDDAPIYKLIRQGRFEATCMLQIMATESQTRDRIWDNLVNVLLMGRKRNPTNNFYSVLESNDYVGLTVMEGSVRNIGDTISMGTPWNPELLTYEASIEFDIVGTFYADEYNEDLVPLKIALVYDYIDLVEEPPFDDDISPNMPFTSKIVGTIPSGDEPIITIEIEDLVPDTLINGERITTLDDANGPEFTILDHNWLATIGKESVLVLMVHNAIDIDDSTLLRIHRAQGGTIPKRHVSGTSFVHGTSDPQYEAWKTWMA